MKARKGGDLPKITKHEWNEEPSKSITQTRFVLKDQELKILKTQEPRNEEIVFDK